MSKDGIKVNNILSVASKYDVKSIVENNNTIAQIAKVYLISNISGFILFNNQ